MLALESSRIAYVMSRLDALIGFCREVPLSSLPTGWRDPLDPCKSYSSSLTVWTLVGLYRFFQKCCIPKWQDRSFEFMRFFPQRLRLGLLVSYL